MKQLRAIIEKLLPVRFWGKPRITQNAARIFEKLLPSRWWHRRPELTEEQWWSAMASPENPQSKAILHVAQDKFVSYMANAAGSLPSEERLRHLDRAMAIADFMTEVDNNFAVAKDEIKRREAAKPQRMEGRG